MPDSSNPEDGPAAAPSVKRRPAARPKPPPRPVRKKVTAMATEAWDGSLPAALRERFGDSVKLVAHYGGQKLVVADLGAVADILAFLKNEGAFDYLVDVTAVHWPDKEQPFELLWILYSFERNERVRVKAALAGDSKAPSATSLYSAANWLEREVYDMFGIEFANHPNLTRILMPDEWEGFPLRKDYGIYEQDGDWVRQNLKIESAQ